MTGGHEVEHRAFKDLSTAKRAFRPYLIASAGMGMAGAAGATASGMAAHNAFSASFGTSMVLGTASFMAAGMLGVIFGVPRYVAETQGRSYLANTNLEQISDWLTKILVGVGLAQGREIVHGLDSIARRFGDVLGSGSQGSAVALALMIVNLASGFFYLYVWARLYFPPLLQLSESFLDGEHTGGGGAGGAGEPASPG